MWRVGAIAGTGGDDPVNQDRLSMFVQEMNKLGWTVGRNLQLEERWGAGNVEHLRKQAVELVALAPDAILASGKVAIPPLLQATRPCQSYSSMSRTRLAQVSSIAWLGPAAM